jgi:hypothetical protein
MDVEIALQLSATHINTTVISDRLKKTDMDAANSKLILMNRYEATKSGRKTWPKSGESSKNGLTTSISIQPSLRERYSVCCSVCGTLSI